jgi:hypothetical protein
LAWPSHPPDARVPAEVVLAIPDQRLSLEGSLIYAFAAKV